MISTSVEQEPCTCARMMLVRLGKKKRFGNQLGLGILDLLPRKQTVCPLKHEGWKTICSFPFEHGAFEEGTFS